MKFNTVNPATGEVMQSYEEQTFAEIAPLIEASHNKFKQWHQTPLADRCKLLGQVGQLLLAQKNECANLITKEMGKPVRFAISEIEKCAWLCEHFATHSEKYLAPHAVKTDFSKSYVSYQALGAIFAIMPWNFPFWQIFRFVGAAVTAGNTILVKPAPITTGCGYAIEKIFLEAGFPKHVLQVILADNETSAKIIAHPHIAGVTITGSVQAGKSVGGVAAEHLKKVVLELGGNDPYLILEDADLDFAADTCLQSRLHNSGQVCISAKRLIVTEKVKAPFLEKILQKISEYKLGDPTDPSVKMGPLAREDLRVTVHEQVNESINKGAKLMVGGVIPQGPGFYYPATVLDQVSAGMPAHDDEIFGPVISIIRAKDDDDALAIANNSIFGLSAAVFTKDPKKGEHFAKNIAAGTVYVNALVSTDPRLPFGGIKASGFGRELSAEGIREFTNVKTICVK